jgi:hypothetical protein
VIEKTATIPLFRHRADGAPEFEGSGVLVTVGNRQFLVTAAHVADENTRHHIIVGGAHKPFPIRRPFYRNSSGHSHSVDLDVAVAELSHSEQRTLLETESIQFINLDPNRSHNAKYLSCRYQVWGYLAKRNETSAPSWLLPANGLRVEIVRDHSVLLHDRQRMMNRSCFIAGTYRASETHFEGTNGGFKPTTPEHFKGFSGGALFSEEPFCPGIYRQFAGICLEAKRRKGGREIAITGLNATTLCSVIQEWFHNKSAPSEIS